MNLDCRQTSLHLKNGQAKNCSGTSVVLFKLNVGQDKFNITEAVIVIYLSLICDVEKIMLQQFLL
jgi:hypothetical protein